MPGWYTKTLESQRAGEINVIGVILEQHPDRCRLFMQWKQMDFPILVDSFNLIGAPLVPLTYLIDESGVVVKLWPGDEDLQAFLDAGPANGEAEAPGYATEGPGYEALRLVSGEDPDYEGAISVLTGEHSDGALAFQRGVAYRMRYDSQERHTTDFGEAVEAWSAALETDPNQYIWRRRIQQFGPRLDKPYPFYSWVDEARAEIRARGETPVALSVEPRGAELTSPERAFSASQRSAEQPDAGGAILADSQGLISLSSVVVPHTSGDAPAARVHLSLMPNDDLRAHWNNEGGGLVVWVDTGDGWRTDAELFEVANLEAPVSDETRTIEFEVHAPEGGRMDDLRVRGYALYYVCEGADGVCLYLRQDFNVLGK